METIISNAQVELDTKIESFKSRLKSLNKSDSFSYMSIVFPIAMNLYKELTSYPRVTSLHYPIDVYSECIALKLIHEYEDKIKNKSSTPTTIPNHALIIMLIQHPFLISLVQMGYSTSQWISKRIELLNECDNLFGTSISPDITTFKNLIQIPLSSNGITSLQLFHFLIGFTYKAEFTGVEASSLKEYGNPEYSFISINVSYNLSNLDSIIIYHSIPKFKQKLLNISTIQEFNAFQKPPHIFVQSKPYTLLNHEFKQINSSKLTEKVFVLINYNDDLEYTKSHYTLAFAHDSDGSNGSGNPGSSNGYLNKHEAENLLNGIITYTIDDVDLKLYLETNFYNLISDQTLTYQELKDDYTQFLTIIQTEYNRSGKDNIAENIVKNPKILDIFDKTEIPFLRAYLLHLSSLMVYDLPSVVNYAVSYLYEGFINTDFV